MVALSFSPNGAHFVIGTGSAKAIVYDRDANKVVQCIKGDPYLLDMAHTHVRWHSRMQIWIRSCACARSHL